jgi:drug/metabolite transporter (DMT)-like permease
MSPQLAGNYLILMLALTAVAGVLLWKERVGVRSWLGIALAVIAIVLIQLGRSAGAQAQRPGLAHCLA